MAQGTAQGSANGPKKIFGRENINWQGPQKAQPHNSIPSHHGDIASARDNFSYDEDMEEFAREKGFDSAEEYDEKLSEVYLSYSTVGGPGEEEMKSNIVAGKVLEEMTRTGKEYDLKSIDELQEKYDAHWEQFMNTDAQRDVEIALNEINMRPSMIDIEYDSEDANGVSVTFDEFEERKWLSGDSVSDVKEKFSDYIKKNT